VTVTNTPLPVQGIVAASLSGPWSVGVNGTPNVNIANAAVPIQGTVNLGNTPNVNIANLPAVTVGNTAASPVLVRDTEQPARAPFQVGANAAIGCGPTVVFSVPSGKEAVIEYLSFSGEGFTSGTPPMAAGTGVAIWTQTANSVTPGSISHDIPVLLHGNSQLFGSPYSHFVATQQLRLYADPETDIKLSGCQNGTGFLATIFSISGYLVNVP
jgi:hypothetical protein